jgi:hypothetical protein
LREATEWIRGEIRQLPDCFGYITCLSRIASAFRVALYARGETDTSPTVLLSNALRDAGLRGDEAAIHALCDPASEHGVHRLSRQGPIDHLPYAWREIIRHDLIHLPSLDAAKRQLRQLGILPKKHG